MCAHQLAGLLAELAAARSATAAALAERDVAVSGWQQEASARIGAEESERRMRKSCAVQVTERCKARVDLSGSREPPCMFFWGSQPGVATRQACRSRCVAKKLGRFFAEVTPLEERSSGRTQVEREGPLHTQRSKGHSL